MTDGGISFIQCLKFSCSGGSIEGGGIGMIFFAAYELGSKVDHSSFAAIWPSVLIFAGALFVLIKYNVDVVYIIPTAGLIGYFLYP